MLVPWPIKTPSWHWPATLHLLAAWQAEEEANPDFRYHMDTYLYHAQSAERCLKVDCDARAE